MGKLAKIIKILDILPFEVWKRFNNWLFEHDSLWKVDSLRKGWNKAFDRRDIEYRKF